MRKLLIAAALGVCLPLTAVGQDAAQILKDYMKEMPSEEIRLNLVHMNAQTVPVLFQPPTLYAMRARASQQTMIYVQATVEFNAELDTTNFVIEQGGETMEGTPTSINNFTAGKLRLRVGDKIDGILTFPKLVDISRPFTLRHGLDKADFRFTEAQIKALTPAAAAQ
jgi:hypothetical protein